MFEEEDDLLDQISAELRKGIPQPELSLEGQNTVIQNFQEIVSVFNREPKHISKFMSSLWGAKIKITGERLLIHKKLSGDVILVGLEEYAQKYIYCPNCGKPDTLLTKKGKKQELHCLSCGHRTSLN